MQPTERQRAFNKGAGPKQKVRQRARDWTTDPATGLSDVACGCGIEIRGYAGDPRVWATELHVCRFEAYSAWGGAHT